MRLSSIYMYGIHGNVALLALKVSEWGKMMLQQPQEWMSAVLLSTDLGKGEIFSFLSFPFLPPQKIELEYIDNK